MSFKSKKLLEVLLVFIKLGIIGFGGPAAHISMMEEEIVRKRNWMSRQKFLDLVGATNLIPGPNSTEMTMHCGMQRAGIPGLFTGGFAFIIPAVALTSFIAFFYQKYGQLPEIQPLIWGIKPAVLTIIFTAVYKLGQKAFKTPILIGTGMIILILAFLGFNEIYLLLGAGVLSLLTAPIRNRIIPSFAPILGTMWFNASLSILLTHSSIKIFLIFLKIGAILYGSGYVLFAYLDAELVEKGLLTHLQLMDAVAIGQFTPGPLLSTATFIGYQLDGWGGAMAATIGVFLPSFFFVMLLNPVLEKISKNKNLRIFLDTVNAAAVAIMAAVLITMSIQTLTDWKSFLILFITIILHYGFKKSSALVTVLSGALLGYLLSLV